MLSRPHPCLGWLYISPADTRRVMDRLLRDRDAELEKAPSFRGMPQAFIDWTWRSWLPANMHRYEECIRENIHYLDGKLSTLNLELDQLDGGVLDNRDAVTDLRERLQRQLDSKEL